MISLRSALHTLWQRAASALDDIRYIFASEVRRLRHDEGVAIFCIIVPLGYPILYSSIYNNEVVRQIPVLAVDMSQTSESREFLRRLDATPDVRIVAHPANMGQAKGLMRKHEAYGVVEIPADFAKKLNSGRQTTVGIMTDMSGMLYFKGLNIAVSTVSLAMNRDIKLSELPGATVRQGQLADHPVAYEEVDIFNPSTGYASFLLPAVLIIIIQQTLILGIGMAAGTDRERNRFNDLVPIDRHFGGTLRIVMGKSMCYILLYVLIAAYVLVLVPHIFSLPQLGRMADLLPMMFLFIVDCTFFALTLTVFVRERETTMLLFVFTSLLFLFLSGVSWPGYAIPRGWKLASWLIPSTFGVNCYVRINSMGATAEQCRPELMAMLAQTAFYFILACLMFRFQIQRSRRHIKDEYMRRKLRLGRAAGARGSAASQGGNAQLS